MPNIKSAKKRVTVTEAKTLVNKNNRNEVILTIGFDSIERKLRVINYIENALNWISTTLSDKTLFPFLKEKMEKFFEENKDDLNSCEFLIPIEIGKAVKNGEKEVKVLGTTAEWHGITYKEDTPEVQTAIKKLIYRGEYPDKLWE